MIFKSVTVLLFVVALTAAGPGLAQSGHITLAEPVTPDQAAASQHLVAGPDGQAALNANVARTLAPDFELADDVTVVDGPNTTGDVVNLPILFPDLKSQIMLSVPVRFRRTATLDKAFRSGEVSFAKGTRLYRQFLPQAPGAMTGYEQWCGMGTLDYTGNPERDILCFVRTVGGKTRLYRPQNAYYDVPFYASAGDFDAADFPAISSYPDYLSAYDGPFPAMTPEARAPADMTVVLMVTHWPHDGDEFQWVLKKGKDELSLKDSGAPPDTATRFEGDRLVFRVGWMDLVFTTLDGRLRFDGLVDLVAEQPELAVNAAAFDRKMAGAGPEVIAAWRLGTLDIDPDSLSLKVAGGTGTLHLKGSIHSKVRLLEGTPPTHLPIRMGEAVGFYQAGDIFYATVLDVTYRNGEPYFVNGWCGAVHKIPGWGRDMKPSRQTCFAPEDGFTAILSDDSATWETRGMTERFGFGFRFPGRLPPYELVALGPEDARDIVMRIYRDRERDPDGDYVFVTLSIKDKEGEREQRTWFGAFDAGGRAVFNLWARRLVIGRDGRDGVTAALADGGDGLGARFVE